MQDFKESLLLMVLQMGFVALLGLALAITAIAQALPWIILAGAVGLCLISITVTGCVIWIRRRQAKQLPPPVVYIIQPGEPPRLLDSRQAEALLEAGKRPFGHSQGSPGEWVIENPKARKQIGIKK